MSENVRATILGFVRKFPAVHSREVERQLGLSDRLAAYHLHALEKQGLVDSLRLHGYLRYVPVLKGQRVEDWAIVAALRRGPAYKVALLLTREGELPQGEIAKRLDLARPSATYHLSQLLKAGVVTVRLDDPPQRWYGLADPARLRRVLRRAPPLPDSLDDFSSMWDELFPR